MGLFNRHKPEEEKKIIISDLGEFIYRKEFGQFEYLGKISSSPIGKDFEISFPTKTELVSDYQIEYFHNIEKNWNKIIGDIQNRLKPDYDIKEFLLKNIMIPDEHNTEYDVDAEIVFASEEHIVSFILHEFNIDQIFYIE